jgi:acetyl-CoA carboxylase beta subunit
MAWFKRTDKGIQTSTEDKKDTPKGLWYKTPSGKIIDTEELKKNLYVSPEDGYHVRIGSKEYFELFFETIRSSYSKEYSFFLKNFYQVFFPLELPKLIF